MLQKTTLSSDHCPECGSPDAGVVDSRPSAEGRLRRKRCGVCGARWTTIELHRADVRFTADQKFSEAANLLAETEERLRQIRETLECFA